MKRQLAAAIFGSPPKSSYEEALKYFMRAEETDPGFWKINRVNIAQCYLKLSKKEEALKWLDLALAMPSDTLDDRNAHKTAEDLRNQI